MSAVSLSLLLLRLAATAPDQHRQGQSRGLLSSFQQALHSLIVYQSDPGAVRVVADPLLPRRCVHPGVVPASRVGLDLLAHIDPFVVGGGVAVVFVWVSDQDEFAHGVSSGPTGRAAMIESACSAVNGT